MLHSIAVSFIGFVLLKEETVAPFGIAPAGAIPVATVQESKDMETIVREINRSYTSIEKGEKEGFDGAVFAEDHIHSVSETVTNKDVHTALSEAVGDLDSHSSLV